MKVELNEKGGLEVTPETGVESFALKHWGEDYFAHHLSPADSEGTATLLIRSCDIERKAPGDE